MIAERLKAAGDRTVRNVVRRHAGARLRALRQTDKSRGREALAPAVALPPVISFPNPVSASPEYNRRDRSHECYQPSAVRSRGCRRRQGKSRGRGAATGWGRCGRRCSMKTRFPALVLGHTVCFVQPPHGPAADRIGTLSQTHGVEDLRQLRMLLALVEQRLRASCSGRKFLAWRRLASL